MALELIVKEPENCERVPPPPRSASDATQAGSRELRKNSASSLGSSGIAMGGGMARCHSPYRPSWWVGARPSPTPPFGAPCPPTLAQHKHIVMFERTFGLAQKNTATFEVTLARAQNHRHF